jgi:methionyl-tRNA formyltransferase
MFSEVIEEGLAKAIAGEPGAAQDGDRASYAPAFTEAEELLDLTRPAATIRRQAAALNTLVTRARVWVAGREATIRDVRPATPVPAGRHAAGTVLATHADGWTVQAGDQPVRLVVR